jgi:hypothetical protein
MYDIICNKLTVGEKRAHATIKKEFAKNGGMIEHNTPAYQKVEKLRDKLGDKLLTLSQYEWRSVVWMTHAFTTTALVKLMQAYEDKVFPEHVKDMVHMLAAFKNDVEAKGNKWMNGGKIVGDAFNGFVFAVINCVVNVQKNEAFMPAVYKDALAFVKEYFDEDIKSPPQARAPHPEHGEVEYIEAPDFTEEDIANSLYCVAQFVRDNPQYGFTIG